MFAYHTKKSTRSSHSSTLVTFFNVGKTKACVRFQVLDIEFLQRLWRLDVYRRVSFTVVDIYISKWQQTLNQSNLKRDTTTFFWLMVWLLWGWAKSSLNQFAHPLPKIRKKLPCPGTEIAQLTKHVHRSPIFFGRCPFWLEVIFKYWKGLKFGVKSPFFSNYNKIYSFWAKHIFLEILVIQPCTYSIYSDLEMN